MNTEFKNALRLLDGKYEKSLANHTLMWAVDDTNGEIAEICIMLYETTIMVLFRDGSIMLSCGKYDTRTTKNRINSFLRRGQISQVNGRWQYQPFDGETVDFYNGMIV